MVITVIYYFVSLFILMLSFMGMRNYRNKNMFLYGLLMLCMAINSLGYTLELTYDTLNVMQFWHKFAYVGASFYPLIIVLFISNVTNEVKVANVYTKCLILLFCFVSLLILITDHQNHLFFSSFSIVRKGGKVNLVAEPGPWLNITHYVLNISFIYAYLMLIVAIYQSIGKPRVKLIYILIGFLFPTLTYIIDIYILSLSSIRVGLFSFLIQGIIVLKGLTRIKHLFISSLTYKLIVDALKEIILVFDNEGYLLNCNRQANKVIHSVKLTTGTHVDEDRNLRYFFNLNDNELIYKYGEHYRCKIIDSPTEDNHIVVLSEVSDLIEAQKYLYHQANSDPLTNISNRRHFLNTIKEIDGDAYFVIIDIDNFKAINDSKGHEFGDKTLVEFSEKLSDNFNGHPLCRYGGEEFVLLFKSSDINITLKQLGHFRKYIEKSGFTISMGVTRWHRDDFDLTFSEADKQMYLAKRRGKNQIFFLDESFT